PKKLGETAGFGVCNGDSGGPVFDERDRALVGIVSWSGRTDGEAVCGFVTGVIPLARYRYWISETAARLGSPLEPSSGPPSFLSVRARSHRPSPPWWAARRRRVKARDARSSC